MAGTDAEQAAKIGAQVRRARRANDWTGKELAERAGVSPGTIVSIENGRPTRPGNLRAVLDALNIPPIAETEATVDDDVKLAVDVVKAALMATPAERRHAAAHDLIRYVTLRQANGL